jgi:hypothetical protein
MPFAVDHYFTDGKLMGNGEASFVMDKVLFVPGFFLTG